MPLTAAQKQAAADALEASAAENAESVAAQVEYETRRDALAYDLMIKTPKADRKPWGDYQALADEQLAAKPAPKPTTKPAAATPAAQP